MSMCDAKIAERDGYQAVIRHQDVLVEGGNITMVGQVLQLATLIGEYDGHSFYTSLTYHHDCRQYLRECTAPLAGPH